MRPLTQRVASTLTILQCHSFSPVCYGSQISAAGYLTDKKIKGNLTQTHLKALVCYVATSSGLEGVLQANVCSF